MLRKEWYYGKLNSQQPLRSETVAVQCRRCRLLTLRGVQVGPWHVFRCITWLQLHACVGLASTSSLCVGLPETTASDFPSLYTADETCQPRRGAKKVADINEPRWQQLKGHHK